MSDIITEKKCNKCGVVKRLDEFHKDKRNKSGVAGWCKKCINANSSRWQKENPESVKAAQERYYKNNPDKVKASQKKYYETHPEKMKAKSLNRLKLWGDKLKASTKKWRQENAERVKETSKLWWIKNTDKRSEYNRRFREKFPERVRLNNEKRRAREQNAKGVITPKEWKELCNKYGNRCLCCGASNVKLTLDHVLPLIMGGTHTIDNAQPLCGSCNSKKGARHIDYR